MDIRQHVVSQSEGIRYRSAPVEETCKGNYYCIYSIIFHIEICTSLFELFSIKPLHDYKGADSFKQTLVSPEYPEENTVLYCECAWCYQLNYTENIFLPCTVHANSLFP